MEFQQGPKRYQWPGNARVALSIVVNVEEGAEANILDGDKYPEPVDEMGIALKRGIRNYGNESNYRYGIARGAPRVMRLLEKHGIRATFTACALALERAPQLAREIVRQGHEVTSHGYRWAHQFHMNEEQEREYIRKAVASLERSTVPKRFTEWPSAVVSGRRMGLPGYLRTGCSTFVTFQRRSTRCSSTNNCDRVPISRGVTG